MAECKREKVDVVVREDRVVLHLTEEEASVVRYLTGQVDVDDSHPFGRAASSVYRVMVDGDVTVYSGGDIIITTKVVPMVRASW